MWKGMFQQNMMNKEIRIHPTQKPVALYEWIFQNYSNQGERILDTHLGSGSSAIAAERFGLDFLGIEIDPEYFQNAKKRFDLHISQKRIF
jgi:site-specific DNA-methyltransferase (adenine-specific)